MNASRSVQRRASARLRTPLRREKLSSREMEAALGYTWYALVTPPQREKHCADALEKLSLTVFTPLERRYRRHSRYRPGQTRRVNVPAYPRYVFLGVPDNEDGSRGGLPWERICHITFVRGFLADPTGRPVTIAGRDVLGIMKASQTPLFVRQDETEEESAPPCEVILPGEEIRVIAGVLSGRTFVASAVRAGVVEVEGLSAAIRIPAGYVRRVA